MFLGQDRERSTLDVLLSTTYSRSQLYLSRQLAQLHPELTMPMFSGEHLLFASYLLKNGCVCQAKFLNLLFGKFIIKIDCD